MVVFLTFGPEEKIPVEGHLPDRKMVKYMSREAKAALAAAGKLFAKAQPEPHIPVYYATDFSDYENRVVMETAREAAGEATHTPGEFITTGLAAVTPLYQFRILQNTPLSLISICFGLKGEHAVVYAASGALLLNALSAPSEGPVLLGAGKTHPDGVTEAGFALVTRDELQASRWLGEREPATLMLKAWAEGGIT